MEKEPKVQRAAPKKQEEIKIELNGVRLEKTSYGSLYLVSESRFKMKSMVSLEEEQIPSIIKVLQTYMKEKDDVYSTE